MGSIINPISYRIGWSHYWSAAWALSIFTNSKYSFLINQDFSLISYLDQLFRRCVQTYLLFSRLKILRTSTTLFFILNYNSPWLEWVLDEVSFLCFALRKQTKKELREKKKPRSTFKPWRPDLSKQELLALRPTIRPINSALHPLRWRVGEFRVILLKAYKVFFLTYILGSAKQYFKYSLSNYTTKPIQLIFVRWTLQQMSAINLAKFMRDKFNTFSTLNQVLRSVSYITRQLLQHNSILGYKIMYKGRFKRLGRRGRATYSWEQKGALPLSTVNSNVSYASIRVRLKYSTCGLKVWLFHS